uniref:Uncharacterized protein n=1 Tax=Rhizophora mucronata TaxID=61149 RepID=A0A2P2PX04_RHIMU
MILYLAGCLKAFQI